MVYDDLEAFRLVDPRRRTTHEYEFGLWRDATGAGHRLAWLEATGELYALRVDAANALGSVQVLGKLPPSGHPSPRRADLIVEAALNGWPERTGRRGSLEWARARLAKAAAAPLAQIDWTVACATRGCPRRGDRIPPHHEQWAQPCEGCLVAREVVTHGMSADQLEARLRAGDFRLADPRHAAAHAG